jgi:LacI family transcriptional regulator
MRLTLNDVAREAGVSTATVDRVLNSALGAVPPEIVVDTARRLVYFKTPIAADPAAAAARLASFCLAHGDEYVRRALQQQLEALGRGPTRPRGSHRRDRGFNPDSLARALAEPRGGARRRHHRSIIPQFARPFVGFPRWAKVVTLVSDMPVSSCRLRRY